VPKTQLIWKENKDDECRDRFADAGTRTKTRRHGQSRREKGRAGVVLMSGGGFGDTHPSARVSLANLNEHECAAIGTAIRRLLDDYYQRYEAERAVKG
jgi:hypothetical protein